MGGGVHCVTCVWREKPESDNDVSNNVQVINVI